MDLKVPRSETITQLKAVLKEAKKEASPTLRSKIEPDADRPRHIHTIRDIGYRFDDGE